MGPLGELNHKENGKERGEEVAMCMEHQGKRG